MNIKSIFAVGMICALPAGAALSQTNTSCPAIERELQQVEREQAELRREFPGTRFVIRMCERVGDEEYRKTRNGDSALAAFGICAAAACLLVGFDNCGNVALREFELHQRKEEIEQRKRQLVCP